MRSLRLPTVLGLFSRPNATASVVAPGLKATQARWEHTDKPVELPKVPPTTPFVPNVETFLTLIGRGLKQHASKFPTWDALFTLSSEQLKELGVEPPRTRRYLLRWRQRFREGRFGPGGDLKYVYNGIARLGVLETEKTPFLTLRHAVNFPNHKSVETTPRTELVRAKGYKIKGVKTVVGPYALPGKKGTSVVRVTEGMWEDKRGHKVDGGERRRAEVRFRRGIAERKAMRERGMM